MMAAQKMAPHRMGLLYGDRFRQRGNGGDHQIVLVHADGLIGLAGASAPAHDLEVDGIKGQLGQNAGQQRLDTHGGMEQAGDESCRHAREEPPQQRHGDAVAVDDHHDAHGAAGAHGAVHGQIGDVGGSYR